MTAVTVADVPYPAGDGVPEPLRNMRSFANYVLLPTVAAVTAATRAITGAAARERGQIAAVNVYRPVVGNLIGGLLVPVLAMAISPPLHIAYSAVGNNRLKQVSFAAEVGSDHVNTIVMLVFVGCLRAHLLCIATAQLGPPMRLTNRSAPPSASPPPLPICWPGGCHPQRVFTSTTVTAVTAKVPASVTARHLPAPHTLLNRFG